ncbi:uncharacterized protein LOC144288501 isoform X1 [Canis aureus]
MAAALPGAAALPPTAVRGASLTRLLGPPAPPTPQPSADPLRFRLPPPVFSRSQNGMASPRNMNRTPSRNRIGCDSVIRPRERDLVGGEEQNEREMDKLTLH